MEETCLLAGYRAPPYLHNWGARARNNNVLGRFIAFPQSEWISSRTEKGGQSRDAPNRWTAQKVASNPPPSKIH
jgi:hypothetical protein